MRRKSMGRARKERAHCAAGGDPFAGADGAGASGQDGDRYAVAGGAYVRPFASLMAHFAGRSTDTPMADAGSVTGAAQPVFPFPCEPRRADELSVFVLHTGHVV